MLQRPLLWRLALLMTALTTFLLAAGQANAFETLPSAEDSAPGSAASSLNWTTSKRPVFADDQCLSLLKSFHIDYNASAMDRTRRSAGDETGIGLVVGIRFALGSGNSRKSANRGGSARLDVWQPSGVTGGDPHALAIADYNRCKGDQALKALSEDWRWNR